MRGSSNSPYSLYDQLGWDPNCFPNGEKDVQKMVESLEKNHSLLSLTDIVLNHTADNTAWLLEHPEAGYNLTTAPWLESAYLLDTKLLELGFNLGKLGLPTEFKSNEDLVKVMDAIKKHVIAEIRLWEYYALNVDRDADAAVESWVVGKTSPVSAEALPAASLDEQVEFLVKHGLKGNDRLGERFRRRIDPNVGAAVIAAFFGRSQGDGNQAAARAKIVELLDVVNVRYYKEYDAEVADILQQLFNRIKYVRLDEHGPRLGPVSRENP